MEHACALFMGPIHHELDEKNTLLKKLNIILAVGLQPVMNTKNLTIDFSIQHAVETLLRCARGCAW